MNTYKCKACYSTDELEQHIDLTHDNKRKCKICNSISGTLQFISHYNDCQYRIRNKCLKYNDINLCKSCIKTKIYENEYCDGLNRLKMADEP